MKFILFVFTLGLSICSSAQTYKVESVKLNFPNEVRSAADPTTQIIFKDKLYYLARPTKIAPYHSIYTCGMDDTVGTSFLENKLRNGANFTILGDHMYFVAQDSIHGYEIWKTDGSDTGTKVLSPLDDTLFRYYPSQLKVFHGKLYFIRESDTSAENIYDFWVYRPGDVSARRLLHRIHYVYYYTAINDRMIFQLYDSYGKLYTTDTGTFVLKPLLQGSKYYSMFSATGPMFRYGSYLYFSGTDSLKGTQLWRTDGTNNGTSLVKIINTDNNSFPDNFVILKNKLLFTAKDDVNGYEIWSSDGTGAGTKRITNLNSSVSGNIPLPLKVYKDRLYFSMDNSISGRELWSTDTAVNSSLFIKDINPGTGNSDVHEMVLMNGLMFFPAAGNGNCMLNLSNGSEAGTRVIPMVGNRPYDALCDLNVNMVHNDTVLFLPIYTVDLGFCIGRCRLFRNSGITDHSSVNALQLYPNPATGILNFSRTCSGSIYSQDGKLIAVLKDQVSFDVSSLNSGLYCFVEASGIVHTFIVAN